MQITYFIESCLQRHCSMILGQRTIDVMRAVPQVIVKVGYLLYDGDAACEIKQ
jgi:hypothetical protein